LGPSTIIWSVTAGIIFVAVATKTDWIQQLIGLAKGKTISGFASPRAISFADFAAIYSSGVSTRLTSRAGAISKSHSSTIYAA
jgi:hypothetical protein